MKQAARPKPKVAVFVTGGTILCHYDKQSNQIIPAMTGAELFEATPGLAGNFELHIVEFYRIPGPHLTPQIGLELARAVERELLREEIAGAVVVQGTDTIEEMSYLLDLLVDSSKTVVVTGAMKSADEPYADAAGNLTGAVLAAADPQLRGCGVVVLFNQTLIPARYAVKTDANRIDSFQARDTGPMGRVQGGKIHLYYRPAPFERVKVAQMDRQVELIKATCGMSPLLLECCIENRVDGIVIEGLGAGNLPPSLVPSIQRALSTGIAVVMTTRCPEGFAEGVYAYEGGGATLLQMGVFYAQNLGGPKARIKLLALLCADDCGPEWKQRF